MHFSDFASNFLRFSSGTRFLCGPFCHSTSIPWRIYLAGLWRHLDSPCLWMFRNYCRCVLCAFFPALVGRLQCVPTHLVLHAHGAYPPLCTASGCLIEWSWTQLRGFLRPSALTASRRRSVVSSGCKSLSGLVRTFTLDHQGRFVPFLLRPPSR